MNKVEILSEIKNRNCKVTFEDLQNNIFYSLGTKSTYFILCPNGHTSFEQASRLTKNFQVPAVCFAYGLKALDNNLFRIGDSFADQILKATVRESKGIAIFATDKYLSIFMPYFYKLVEEYRLFAFPKDIIRELKKNKTF